ncbi:hypothetical protein GH714_022244 [Hevea brasiliensis]|uniref:ZF-HD dimerization-type domain-containing protein n=1 Tax=Hevea brasiliensis TaxID=3981 RepID=A0A6A6MU96_HEVBR|nr:hypothetical protein GH714_022244 [Hevea brasiliensis]
MASVGKATGGTKSKRYRTKFTNEQKDRMLEFAEKIGWRIHKHDNVALNQFCNEIGVTRNVLKMILLAWESSFERQLMDGRASVKCVVVSFPQPDETENAVAPAFILSWCQS